MITKYIAFRPFHRKALGGEVCIRRGDPLVQQRGFLYYNGIPICIWNSQAAKEHFAPNNDGNGIMRGDITFAIAFASSLSDTQKRIILKNPSFRRFLKNDNRVLLFNDDFFAAPIMELTNMAWKLGIKEE